MLALPELQAAFARGLFEGVDPALAQVIETDAKLDAAARVAIYRENVLGNYRNALGDVFPVIERLVGADFMRQLARAYSRAYPSASGDLHDFGAGMAEFLAEYRPVQALPYLPDVARLEWALHRVFHADEVEPLSIQALAACPPERLGELRFELNPAARLIASDYPVVRIWRVNQPGYAGDDHVDLSEGGVRALVIRRALERQVEPLAPAEHAMLSALADAAPLASAYEQAAALDSGFEFDAFLQRHVLGATLTRMRLD